ncbi:MAG: UDP-N-acetylmuramate--L-alanine ligase [Actinobacteria bacterium]|uniref:UDP-N-acetylmuramate--L-alanine ligase n=1 Tax=freshwater metagenome TaxID=449393 RepID=A0A6J7CWU6_9ZZZZ|nr:UDP-N-acetylmuramate--L-alanine ligase [Actinomycetota bacterium]
MTEASFPWAGRQLHFVGIGGAGMSGLARISLELGAVVSGSDRAAGVVLQELGGLGADVMVGHQADNLPEGAELVYSSAVGEENSERSAAAARGQTQMHRSELLGELTQLKPTIAVTGTHGKTTTSAMVLAALEGAGLRPGWVIGAQLAGGRPSAGWGSSPWLVVEADESDRSLLALHTEVAVVTNCELDHHATYSSLDDLRATLSEFLGGAQSAVVWDQPDLVSLVPSGTAVYPYDALAPGSENGRAEFTWRGVSIRLAVPGLHNGVNASGALEAASLTGVDQSGLISGIEAFRGTARRFEELGVSSAGARLVDDYAHHPTEVAATIQAARSLNPKRVVLAFQPHLFSRTQELADEFGSALAGADVVLVSDIYPAREVAEDFPGVDAGMLVSAAGTLSSGSRATASGDLAQTQAALEAEMQAGDLVILMGAGDIGTLGRRLVGS